MRELTRDARVVAIVRGVINLARDLGLDVVAEGVETTEQARLLVDLGCTHAQGYLWARAVPADDLTRRLTSAMAPARIGVVAAAAPAPSGA